tara:strand:- start:688 stop:1041 length:354 start_codon:yes stop_codon:yes gene_type:complete
MGTCKTEMPKGCFNYFDQQRITAKDIYFDRPYDQCRITTERAIRHFLIVKKRFRMFRASIWVVQSATTYEMAGDYRHTYMGGRSWAETDLTGLEWQFYNKEDAEKFAYKGERDGNDD